MRWGWTAAIVVATFAVYSGTWHAPFVFDDFGSILQNRSIRSLHSFSSVLHPPADAGVGGRPLANLTFALNYAFGELNPVGYHVFNTALHVLNALLLFGIVRRTLARFEAANMSGAKTDAIAGLAALLWAVHPLNTAAVTYVSQRTEVLMGSAYLATLYAFIRSQESREARFGWKAVAVCACAAGILTKEVVATAPLLVLLYEASFGSLKESWRRNRRFYAALAGTWLLLPLLAAGLTSRAVGFGLGISPLRYAAAQAPALLEYWKLIVWPHPLIFDRGSAAGDGSAAAVVAALIVLAALVSAVAAFRRARRAAFPVLGFFLLLAPTSSFVPILRQPVAENRVYLPGALVLTALVVGAVRLCGWRRVRAGFVVAGALGALCVARNAVYATGERLWTEAIAQRPDNARAFDWLGTLTFERGDSAEAVRLFRHGLALDPNDPTIRKNLAAALASAGDVPAAVAEYQEVLRRRPDFAEAHSGLGYLLWRLGRTALAREQVETALRLKPDSAEACNHLGLMLPDAEAVAVYRRALQLDPTLAEAHNNLAGALFRLGRRSEALEHFEAAVRLAPGFAGARENLAHARAIIEREQSGARPAAFGSSSR
jgi:Flp pilus assembly protein TadD